MNRKLPTIALAAAVVVALASCDAVRPPPPQGAADPSAQAVAGCTHCHGDPSRTDANPLVKAAPPFAVDGSDGGAHLAHLRGGAFRSAIDCSECHVVPTSTRHLDGKIDLAFGPLARSGGAQPAFAGGSCSSVYCHGATLSAGGTATEPAWSGGAALSCQSCHGYPPPSHAPTSTDCATCHPGTVKPDGTIDLALGNHIDGKVEADGAHAPGWSAKDQHGYAANRQGLSACKRCHGTNLDGAGGSGPSCTTCHASAGFASWSTTCTFCHGNRTTGAANPPVDTQGGSAATSVTVGVHAAHVGTTLTSTPIGCVQCHPDRTGSNVITDAAHIDGDGVAEIQFGALATTGGVSPVYTRVSATSATCASTYCHGSFYGGANATPEWTSTAQAGCTSCHGAPPSVGAQGHHAFRTCSECHPSFTSTTVNPALHLNGKPDVGNKITSYSTTTHTCTNTCHGNETWR